MQFTVSVGDVYFLNAAPLWSVRILAPDLVDLLLYLGIGIRLTGLFPEVVIPICFLQYASHHSFPEVQFDSRKLT